MCLSRFARSKKQTANRWCVYRPNCDFHSDVQQTRRSCSRSVVGCPCQRLLRRSRAMRRSIDPGRGPASAGRSDSRLAPIFDACFLPGGVSRAPVMHIATLCTSRRSRHRHRTIVSSCKRDATLLIWISAQQLLDVAHERTVLWATSGAVLARGPVDSGTSLASARCRCRRYGVAGGRVEGSTNSGSKSFMWL